MTGIIKSDLLSHWIKRNYATLLNLFFNIYNIPVYRDIIRNEAKPQDN